MTKDLLRLTNLFSFLYLCEWQLANAFLNLNFHGIKINSILTSYSHPVLYKGVEPLFSARKAGVLTVRQIELLL